MGVAGVGVTSGQEAGLGGRAGVIVRSFDAPHCPCWLER